MPTKPPTRSTDKTDRRTLLGTEDVDAPPTRTGRTGQFHIEGDTERRLAASGGAPKRNTRRTGQAPVILIPDTPPPPLPAPPAAGPVAAAPSGSRLATQLGRVFKRKRELIGLTVAQIAGLTGIPQNDIINYEMGGKTPYDHALVMARVLGIPAGELPGIRGTGESPARAAIAAAVQGLSETVRCIYYILGEERLEGPVDALTGVTEFAVEIGDDGILEYPRGSILGFVRDRGAQPMNDPGLVLAHHWRSRVMTLRRIQQHLLVGLHPEVPSYHLDRGAWEILGRLAIVIHPVS